MTVPTHRLEQETGPVPGHQARRIANASFRLVLLLLVQYVLGIAYNLYGTAPTATKKVTLFSGPLIAVHVVVGTLLILGAVYLVVISVRARSRLAVTASALGLLSLIAAWVTGSAFTENGDSGFSMAMGVTTAVALLCYLVNVRRV
ncbi:MAG TPA: hypothetical protein VHT26_23340 [Trebonia sp.]|nr:hypothetical protein [Trebonia sp.]